MEVSVLPVANRPGKATLNPMHSTANKSSKPELLPCVRRRNVRVTAWAWADVPIEVDWVISFHSNDEGFINDAL